MSLANLYRLVAHIAPHTSARFGYGVCELLGALAGPRLPAYRHIRHNLSVVMPGAGEQEHDAIARRVLIGIFKNYFDLFRFGGLNPTERGRGIVVKGVEHAQRALAGGRGLIVVAPHCGNYTIIFAPLVERFGVQALLVVEQMRDARVHDVMNGLRRSSGVEVVPLGPPAGRAVIRALRENRVVFLAGDRALSENTLEVDFFGRPTPIPSGPATLALRTNTPLLTASTYRLPDSRSLVLVDPPLSFERSDDLQVDIWHATQQIAYSMESYIRRDPSQWLVAEDVWPNE